MSTWRTVHRTFTSQGPKPEVKTERAMVNLDLVAAIVFLPTGRNDGARSKLLWHTTSPRCEWTVTETMEELTQ